MHLAQSGNHIQCFHLLFFSTFKKILSTDSSLNSFAFCDNSYFLVLDEPKKYFLLSITRLSFGSIKLVERFIKNERSKFCCLYINSFVPLLIPIK